MRSMLYTESSYNWSEHSFRWNFCHLYLTSDQSKRRCHSILIVDMNHLTIQNSTYLSRYRSCPFFPIKWWIHGIYSDCKHWNEFFSNFVLTRNGCAIPIDGGPGRFGTGIPRQFEDHLRHLRPAAEETLFHQRGWTETALRRSRTRPVRQQYATHKGKPPTNKQTHTHSQTDWHWRSGAPWKIRWQILCLSYNRLSHRRDVQHCVSTFDLFGDKVRPTYRPTTGRPTLSNWVKIPSIRSIFYQDILSNPQSGCLSWQSFQTWRISRPGVRVSTRSLDQLFCLWHTLNKIILTKNTKKERNREKKDIADDRTIHLGCVLYV